MMRLTCKHCNYFLGDVEVMVGELLCPNSSCKGTTQFKMLNNDMSELIKYKFTKAEQPPKKKELKK